MVKIAKLFMVLVTIFFVVGSYAFFISTEMTRIGEKEKIVEETPKSDVLKYDVLNDSTYDSIILKNMESHKNLTYELPNEPSYILRLDDVQTPIWSNISMRIINDTLSRNMSITIAIIPNRTQEDTNGLMNYIKNQKNNPQLEIAQHGFNHSYYEYDNISENDAKLKTMCGLRYLYFEFNTTPKTFIPPNNAISSKNNTTVNVLHDMGFKILSSSGDIKYEGNIMNIGQTISTKNDGILNDPDDIIKVCETDFKEQNLSVIMIHPQDYVDDNGRKTLDPVKYANYLELLDKLNNTNAKSITFRDLLN